MQEAKNQKISTLKTESYEFSEILYSVKYQAIISNPESPHWNLLVVGDQLTHDKSIKALSFSDTTFHDICLELAKQSGTRLRFDDDSIAFIKLQTAESTITTLVVDEQMNFKIGDQSFTMKAVPPSRSRAFARNTPATFMTIGNDLGMLVDFIDAKLLEHARTKRIQTYPCSVAPEIEDVTSWDFSITGVSMERAIVLIAEDTNTTAVFEDAIIRFEPKK